MKKQSDSKTKIAPIGQDAPQGAEQAVAETTPKLRSRRCKVISYNPHSGVVVFDCNGKIWQSNAIAYDGSGYVNWAC